MASLGITLPYCTLVSIIHYQKWRFIFHSKVQNSYNLGMLQTSDYARLVTKLIHIFAG